MIAVCRRGARRRSTPKKTLLGVALAGDVAREVEALLGHEAALDFEAVEMAARREALRVAARVVEHHLNADTSDRSEATLECACGGQARYVKRQWKVFDTVLGPLRLSRAYYYCESCREGFCPRDRELGFEGTSVSPGVLRMTGIVASLVSFAEGSELLRELAGVSVGAKQVERLAEALGDEVAEDERCFLEAPEAPSAPTEYLGMDGTGVPMRKSELEGRRGKQEDGSSKTREVKLCTIFTAESRDDKGRAVRDEGSVTYSAGIESAANIDIEDTPSAFVERVLREARRRGFEDAKRQVVLGDGASWIWKLAEMHFPQAIQIVDRFHVKEHLSDVGKALYGPTSDLARAWSNKRHAELDLGRLDDLLRALKRQAPHCKEAQACIAYIQAHRHRMRYPEFQAQGLCTSTAVVEAGCKVAVCTRLKRAGMHWTQRGANAIIALRCCRLNGRFESFWERRTARARAS